MVRYGLTKLKFPPKNILYHQRILFSTKLFQKKTLTLPLVPQGQTALRTSKRIKKKTQNFEYLCSSSKNTHDICVHNVMQTGVL